MKAERTIYTVEEICKGFTYNEAEGKGLFGLSGRLTIQPEPTTPEKIVAAHAVEYQPNISAVAGNSFNNQRTKTATTPRMINTREINLLSIR